MEQTMSGVLRQIIQSQGEQTLLDTTLTLALFADFAPTMKKERELLRVFLLSDGVTTLFDVRNGSAQEITSGVERIVSEMVNGHWVAEPAARLACAEVYFAITGRKLQQKPAEKPAAKPAASAAAQTASAPAPQTPYMTPPTTTANPPSADHKKKSPVSRLIVLAVAVIAVFVLLKSCGVFGGKDEPYNDPSATPSYNDTAGSKTDEPARTTAVTTTEAPKNHSMSAARLLNFEEPYSDALPNQKTDNWYFFELDAPGAVTMEFTHEGVATSDNLWKVYLYQEDGETFVDGGDRIWYITGEKNLKTSAFGLPAGRYYVRIAPYSSSQWSDTAYELALSLDADTLWEQEQNSDKFAATALPVNTVICGSISSDSDKDWYVLKLTEAGYVTFDLTHDPVKTSDNLWDMRLYREDGDSYLEDGYKTWYAAGDSDIKTAVYGLPAGTYYVCVGRYSSSQWDSATYYLTANFTADAYWEQELNNTKFEALSMELNTPYHGAVTYDDDEDWYTFKLTEAGYVTLDFTHDPVSTTDNLWRFSFYRDDGDTHYDGGYREFYVAGDTFVTTPQVGLPEGTYYVRVRSNSSYYDDAVYTLTANFTADAYWERELNNTKFEALPMAFGTAYSGATTSDDDEDWYSFTLDAGRSISLVFNHASVNTSDRTWYVHLYEENGDLATSDSYWSVRGDENMTRSGISLPAGKYYVRVKPYSSSDDRPEPYSLTVN